MATTRTSSSEDRGMQEQHENVRVITCRRPNAWRRALKEALSGVKAEVEKDKCQTR